MGAHHAALAVLVEVLVALPATQRPRPQRGRKGMVVVVGPRQQQVAAVLGQEQEAGAHSKSAITQSGCGSLPLVPVNQSIASITCVPFLQPPQQTRRCENAAGRGRVCSISGGVVGPHLNIMARLPWSRANTHCTSPISPLSSSCSFA